MTSIYAFTQFAISVGQKLTSCRNNLDAPFVRSYPENCCELVSIHLGLTLQAANSESEVEIVRAYNRDNDEWHYWVEMNNLVFDLTAHQFEGYKKPLVCAEPSPFEIRFPDMERISIGEAEIKAQFGVNSKIMHILSDCYQLATTTPLAKQLP